MPKCMKAIAGTVLLVLCITMLICYPGRAQNTEGEQLPHNPVYDADKDTADWDYIYFGQYPQTELEENEITPEIIAADYDEQGDAVIDGQKYRRIRYKGGNYSSDITVEGFYDWSGRDFAYFRYEPLRWRVLKVDEDAIFLMADKVADCRKYHYNDSSVTWAASSLRDWLNGYGTFATDGFSFLDNAFSEEERADILLTNVTDSDNLLHGTQGGSDTKDKVFLMSVREMLNPEYGFPADYMCYSNTRMLEPTDYARAMGVWTGTENAQYGKYCWWMLRTPGSHTKAVSLVYRFGHVYQDGYYADTPYYGVCPAIRIDRSSSLWRYAQKVKTKQNVCSTSEQAVYAGDVDEDGTVTLEDAQEVLKMALRIREKGSMDICDVDQDGSITLMDARYILRYALKMIKHFPVESCTKPPQQASAQPELPSIKPPASVRPSQKPVTIPTLPPQKTYAPAPEQGELKQKEYDASGRIWIAADSIAVSYHSTEAMGLCGWGEVIGEYFADNVTIYNKAIGGRSSKSYIQETEYKDILNGMQEGDYLLISFGHNDERASVDLYTDPYGSSSVMHSYKWYLKQYYIEPAIRAGVQPVLISPVARRYFYQGEFVNPQLHTPYMNAMEELVQEYAEKGIKVYYINLHQYMLDMYEQLGEEGTYSLHAKNDTTHLCRKGIDLVCDYLTGEMKKQNMDITVFLK